MLDVLEWIYEFLSSVLGFLVDIFIWVLDSFFYLFTEPLYLALDGFLTLVLGIFTVLDLSGLMLDTALDWSDLPDQLVWILSEVDFSQGLTIIMSGVAIRMGLNLIPGAITRI